MVPFEYIEIENVDKSILSPFKIDFEIYFLHEL